MLHTCVQYGFVLSVNLCYIRFAVLKRKQKKLKLKGLQI